MEYSKTRKIWNTLKHGIRGMRGNPCVKLKWSGVFRDSFEQKKRFSFLY